MFLICCLILLEAATRAWVRRVEPRAAPDALNVRSLAPAAPGACDFTCHQLSRLLDELRSLNICAQLVAVPTFRDSGRTPPVLKTTAAADEAEVLDLTSAPGLVESSYQDRFHLNESGARLFSEHFARVVEPLK